MLEEVPGIRLTEQSLMVAVKNIARRLGSDISEEKPTLDSRLPDGSRVAAVIPPCSLGGVTLTIRKFTARRFNPEEIVRRIADYRSTDKHDPEYYARHTVEKAQAENSSKSPDAYRANQPPNDGSFQRE